MCNLEVHLPQILINLSGTGTEICLLTSSQGVPGQLVCGSHSEKVLVQSLLMLSVLL